jgi:hypothetical protein
MRRPPAFAAFCAKRWAGMEYETPALFTFAARGGKTLAEATRVRIFHAFGPTEVAFRGKAYSIPREKVIQPGSAAPSK